MLNSTPILDLSTGDAKFLTKYRIRTALNCNRRELCSNYKIFLTSLMYTFRVFDEKALSIHKILKILSWILLRSVKEEARSIKICVFLELIIETLVSTGHFET